MAIDKSIDSAQLDADLASVADAIRTKGGTSAQLAFPADFVQAIADIETGGGGKVTHVQYTAASDATTTEKGGNALDFYNTYMSPNIPSSGNVIVICFVTNNTASGNYARIMEYYRDQKLRGTTARYYFRGTGNVSENFQSNYDFFYTSGSLIDIWILEDVLS